MRLDERIGGKKGLEAAAKTDIQVVLQNLTGLKIRGDYKAGPDRGILVNVAIY